MGGMMLLRVFFMSLLLLLSITVDGVQPRSCMDRMAQAAGSGTSAVLRLLTQTPQLPAPPGHGAVGCVPAPRCIDVHRVCHIRPHNPPLPSNCLPVSVLAAGGRWVDDGLTERLFRRANATLEDRKGKRAMTVEENAADNRTLAQQADIKQLVGELQQLANGDAPDHALQQIAYSMLSHGVSPSMVFNMGSSALMVRLLSFPPLLTRCLRWRCSALRRRPSTYCLVSLRNSRRLASHRTTSTSVARPRSLKTAV